MPKCFGHMYIYIYSLQLSSQLLPFFWFRFFHLLRLWSSLFSSSTHWTLTLCPYQFGFSSIFGWHSLVFLLIQMSMLFYVPFFRRIFCNCRCWLLRVFYLHLMKFQLFQNRPVFSMGVQLMIVAVLLVFWAICVHFCFWDPSRWVLGVFRLKAALCSASFNDATYLSRGWIFPLSLTWN